MFYNAKEKKLNLYNTQIDTISFGSGKKKLIMIQGLNTRGIKGASVSLAYMYRLLPKSTRCICLIADRMFLRV